MHSKRLVVVPLLLLGSASNSSAVAAAELPFTSAQAERGQAAYEEHCASCHGRSLRGTARSPGLIGEQFDTMWRGRSADVLSFHVRRMPPVLADGVEPLSEATHTDILAYLFQANGFAAGEATLPVDMSALADLRVPTLPGAASFDPDAPVELSRRQTSMLANLPEVTSAMLDDPAPGNWLRWGRSASGQNSSPLATINKENVTTLAPAWRAPLRPGPSMSVPLVLDGVMFLHTFPDTVLALDAVTGDVLWRYQHETKGQASSKMGIALHGNKVLVPTSDLHMLALDMRSGKLLWDHEIRTEAENSGPLSSYQLRSAPLVAGGKVLQGVTASFVSRGGFILAVDLETGEESWRFNTIPRPGEPGDESWNDVPLDRRSGGSVWHQGTYDPELNLVYYGVAPTYDTGPLLEKVDTEGVSNDALYTNCTLALNPETGKLVWYYQHVANDQWDLDWAFERQLATMTIDGEERRVVMNAGKIAILEVLDAATGEYLFSLDPGVQTIITAIDPETGEKTIDPETLPSMTETRTICPDALGARNWPPTSFDPEKKLAYMPLIESCMTFAPPDGSGGFKLLTTGVNIGQADHAAAADGKIARIQAIDVGYRELAWSHDLIAPLTTSLLVTGGGLLFSGDLEPSLKAFDSWSGELLWRAQLDAPPSSSIITYEVNGKQYLAVLAGIGNLHVGGMARAYAQVAAKTEVPEAPPSGGPALWVFALQAGTN